MVFLVQVYLVFTTNDFPWLTIVVVLPISAGSLIFFLPHRGNKVIRWYTICICIIELLLITYTFGYHFQLDDPLIQLTENYKWIHFLIFTGDWEKMEFLEDLFYRQDLSLLKLLKRPGRLLEIPDYSISGCEQCIAVKEDHFLLKTFYFFFIMWELELIPVYLLLSIWGGKKRLYSATKFILYTAGASVFLLIGVLGIGLYGSNEPTLNFETSANQSYPVALEIIFYIGFFYCFCCQIADYTLTYMVTRHPWRGTLQYLYASSWNIIKNGSVWSGSYKYAIITSRSFYLFSLVDHSRHNSNNLCSFNISGATKFKKKNSLFLRISYGFHNYRNWFYKRYRTQWSHFTNNLSWIYWRCAFFLGRNELRKNMSCLSRGNGRNGYRNSKNIHDFQYLIDGFSCITGHERFCCRIDSIFWNTYKPKISFNYKNSNYFCNGNWNDINSYLLIIYVTSDVLWIQAFKCSKLLFFRFWATRAICFALYTATCNSYWDLSGFRFLTISRKSRSYSIKFFYRKFSVVNKPKHQTEIL
nr:NADH-plastoquinone oxidoreductase subunit 4 [Ziziphus hajarensis]